MENERISLDDLERRWERALDATQAAVGRHPDAYRTLKELLREILHGPLDIMDYLPTARKLAALLGTLDPGGRGSIFQHFEGRIAPTDVWQVNLLRMECRDLLTHLEAFDEWRLASRRLKVVK